jgi:crossover junction endodeoxyribonuclease RusA
MMMLPYPISTNRYWRNFGGRTVRSSEAVAYKDEVGFIALSSEVKMLDGPVQVDMVLHPPAPKDWEKRQKKNLLWALDVRRIDLDNAQKVALDALQGFMYADDRQITSLSIRLGQPLVGGGLGVVVTRDVIWGVPV